jgi:hypothetical protein
MLIAALLLSLQATVTPPAAAPASAEKPKRICRTVEATGTRMSRTRICKYPEEWEQQRQDAEDFARAHQRDIDLPATPMTPASPR